MKALGKKNFRCCGTSIQEISAQQGIPMIVFLVVQILVVHFYGIEPRMRRLEEIQ